MSVSQRIVRSSPVLCYGQDGCVSWEWEARWAVIARDGTVKALLAEYQLWTYAELSHEASIATSTIPVISVKKLKMWWICAHGLHSVWQVGMWQWMGTARLLLYYYAHEDEAFFHEVIMMEGMWTCSYKPWVQETVKWITSPRVNMPKNNPGSTVNAGYY
jgi:hypothetical protein